LIAGSFVALQGFAVPEREPAGTRGDKAMKANLTAYLVAAAGAALIVAAPAIAQRGPPAGVGGGGPPAGVGGGPPSGFGGGPPSSFPGDGNGAGHGPWGADGSFTQPGGQFGMSSGASTQVLTNPNATLALSNALTHSGITLPTGGLQAACGGFRNLGTCVAALHVAQNLSLTGGFDSLKTLMTTGDKLSLGKAIGQLKPTTDTKSAEKSAKKQANADLRRANSNLDG
jgi:hypothetical protein